MQSCGGEERAKGKVWDGNWVGRVFCACVGGCEGLRVIEVHWSKTFTIWVCGSADALWPSVKTPARKLESTINHRTPPLLIKKAPAMMYEPCHSFWLVHTHTHMYITMNIHTLHYSECLIGVYQEVIKGRLQRNSNKQPANMLQSKSAAML